MAAEVKFFAPLAWLEGGWARDVVLTVDSAGHWASVEPGAPTPGAERLEGLVLPGIVDAHSHAFQRAIAGLTERSGGRDDDFWSWRDRMYSAALRIGPQQVEAIATQLYAELLAGGYTHVCEFHYLHNDVGGSPYADAPELSMALVRAAQAAGIGLTLLPTLYMRSGFGAKGLREDQRRFASTPAGILRIAEAVNGLGLPNVNAGVALHSLRAVDTAALHEVAHEASRLSLPVHIHIAEQVQEVEDCLAHHGRRPIEWLLENAPVCARWNLVHATHTVAAELEALQKAGASIVICPTTEANLGDGIFDYAGWAGRGGRWSIGSDSHVTRCAAEELRLLEYSQRFAQRKRNVASRTAGTDSTAATLLAGALEGGEAATGLRQGGIAVGRRADFCLLDARAPSLIGIPQERLLDAWMFSSPGAQVMGSWVGGRRTAAPAGAAEAFRAAMAELWA
ncbi:MAG: formimidoylglutamate deiminase [Burkholderiaceae bacterium]